VNIEFEIFVKPPLGNQFTPIFRNEYRGFFFPELFLLTKPHIFFSEFLLQVYARIPVFPGCSAQTRLVEI
jgi:hypothetical protein